MNEIASGRPLLCVCGNNRWYVRKRGYGSEVGKTRIDTDGRGVGMNDHAGRFRLFGRVDGQWQVRQDVCWRSVSGDAVGPATFDQRRGTVDMRGGGEMTRLDMLQQFGIRQRAHLFRTALPFTHVIPPPTCNVGISTYGCRDFELYIPRLRLKRRPLITNFCWGNGRPSRSSRMTIAEAPLNAVVAALITSPATVAAGILGALGSGSGATKSW